MPGKGQGGSRRQARGGQRRIGVGDAHRCPCHPVTRRRSPRVRLQPHLPGFAPLCLVQSPRPHAASPPARGCCFSSCTGTAHAASASPLGFPSVPKPRSQPLARSHMAPHGQGARAGIALSSTPVPRGKPQLLARWCTTGLQGCRLGCSSALCPASCSSDTGTGLTCCPK